MGIRDLFLRVFWSENETPYREQKSGLRMAYDIVVCCKALGRLGLLRQLLAKAIGNSVPAILDSRGI